MGNLIAERMLVEETVNEEEEFGEIKQMRYTRHGN